MIIVNNSHMLSSIVSTCSSIQLLPRPAMAPPTPPSEETFEETYELVNDEVGEAGEGD